LGFKEEEVSDKMEKCAIFIDGGYVDKLLETWNDFDLDYFKLSQKICQQLKLDLLRVYYYNCLPIIRRMYEIVCSECGKKFKFCRKTDGDRKIFCEDCYKKLFERESNFFKITPEKTKEDEALYEKKEKLYNKIKKLPR
jgi:CxxC-x17-CxxC domain-containing protein